MSERYANRAKNGGYNYLPDVVENGPLWKHPLGTVVTKTVRAMGCIYKGEQGFGIYDVEEEDYRYLIAGSFPYPLLLNNYYCVTGEIAVDRQGRREIKVQKCEAALPADRAGVVTVLRTLYGLDTQADALYDIVGPDILQLLIDSPEQVSAKVKGVGLKRAKAWQAELLSRGENDRELRRLYSLGLTPQQATKLVAEHGLNVCSEVLENPYLLRSFLRGFSFKKCDKMAMDKGGTLTNPNRIREGVVHVLDMIALKGNSSCPKAAFLRVCHEALDLSLTIRPAMQLLRSADMDGNITLRYGAELFHISNRILQGAVDEWHRTPHRRNERFCFVVESVPDAAIEQSLRELQASSRIILEEFEGIVYVTPGYIYAAEQEIVANVRALVDNERLPFKNRDAVIRDVLAELHVDLEEKQMEAVQRICQAEGGVFILGGSAGCGKTFTLNIIMRVLNTLYQQEREFPFDPCVLAPTSKAAKVAERSTQLTAQTIHRAFGIISDEEMAALSGTSLYNNCIVIDEFSMVDVSLCAAVLHNIPKTAKVIILGDIAQLPSIRPGRVLRDLSGCGVVPTITLNVVRRQGTQSGVLLNAVRILQGQMICTEISNQTGMNGNAYVRKVQDPFLAQAQVLKMAKNCGLAAFQKGQVQVLCPVKAGALGTNELNHLLQSVLNPKGKPGEVIVGTSYLHLPDGRERTEPKCFREGDLVIHTHNNYEAHWYKRDPARGYVMTGKKGVINGDTGVVRDIRSYLDSNGVERWIVYVRYDDHYIAYDNDFGELSLAYALTIHKSQGSQWPIVIGVIVQPTTLLSRKLIYTMYTRAQETSIVIARDDLLARGIGNDREENRFSLLQYRMAAMGP